jgi:hypothetical protein
MKQKLMKFLMLSCRDACFLMTRKQEGKLGAFNRIRLRMHTAMCALCKRFEVQTDLIASESKASEVAAQLSEETKSHIRRAIQDSR